MALIRFSELKKMSKLDRTNKLKELKLELIKSQLASSKNRSKKREIKRTIAKILTLAKTDKEVSKNLN